MDLQLSTRARWLLAALALAGLLGPWFYNWRYFAQGGSVAPAVFWHDAFANALTAAITLDVYLAAVSFSVAVACDRAAGARRWWALPLCFLVGLAVALPAYLLWRSAGARPTRAPRG
jgi:hypothetical protein